MGKYSVFSMFLMCFTACIEPFDIESIAYEDLLVVDGFISTDAVPYKITLSRTYPLDTFQVKPETNATVWIENSNGEIVSLQEGPPGDYFTPTDFFGLVGVDYQLFITTHSGNQYASERVNLKRTPDIDQIYGAFISKPPDNKGEVASGIQFFLDSHDPTNNTRFYRWEWSDTYEILTPYASFLKYEDGKVVDNNESFTRCWQSGVSKNITIHNSLALSEDRITKFPIRFIDQRSQAMRVRYSLQVKQYALTEDAYNFWKRLQETNESQGTLFDAQPGTVVGNMKSITNNDELVLGYFYASEVKTKRQFFNPRDFSGFVPALYNYRCVLDTLPKVEMGFVTTIHDFMENHFGSHNILYATHGPSGTSHYVAPKPCSDCSLFANPERPEFWID